MIGCKTQAIPLNIKAEEVHYCWMLGYVGTSHINLDFFYELRYKPYKVLNMWCICGWPWSKIDSHQKVYTMHVLIGLPCLRVIHFFDDSHLWRCSTLQCHTYTREIPCSFLYWRFFPLCSSACFLMLIWIIFHLWLLFHAQNLIKNYFSMAITQDCNWTYLGRSASIDQ